jgi:hypothetical protein
MSLVQTTNIFKPSVQIHTYDAFELLKSHHKEFTLDHLLESRKQSGLEEAEEPEPQPKERAMMVLKLAEGMGSLKLTLRCLRTLIGTSSEQQQLDKELCGCLL